MTEDELTARAESDLAVLESLANFVSFSIDRDIETKKVIDHMKYLIKALHDDRQRLRVKHAQDTKSKEEVIADIKSILLAIKPFVDAKDQDGLRKITNGTFWLTESLHASLSARYNKSELENQKHDNQKEIK